MAIGTSTGSVGTTVGPVPSTPENLLPLVSAVPGHARLRPSRPDAWSVEALRAITVEQHARLAADPDLALAAVERGVDLPAILANLRLEAPDRLRVVEDGHGDGRFTALLRMVAAHRVRSVLIGGIAGVLYGSNLGTEDFDICHARDARNLSAIAGLLRDLRAEYRRLPQYAPALLEPATLSTETDFVFTTTRGKFDLIGRFTGVGEYPQALAAAAPVRYAGVDALVLSLPKLMSSKLSTGRPKDLEVRRELEVVQLAYALLRTES